jgi:predicted DNA-binding transcriptional regulator YafY
VLKAAAWYLVAANNGTARIYRVSGIREMRMDGAGFERPTGFELPAFWSIETQRFEASLRPKQAVLRATALGQRKLQRLGAYAAKAVREAEPADDGHAVVRLPIENVDDAARLVLGVGPEIDALDPPPLRARVRELASAVVQRLALAEEPAQ